MTCKDCIKWLENLKSDLGKSQFSELWHYEQALAETIELLQSGRLVELPCKVGDTFFYLAQYTQKGELSNKYFINERQVSAFEYNGELCIYDYDGIDFSLNDIFFDKSKAEAKLKELNENGKL